MKHLQFVFFAIALLLLSCSNNHQNATENDAAKPSEGGTVNTRVPVKVAVVRKGTLLKTVTIYGKLKPKRITRLGSQFAGRITDLSLSEGDRVKKGQIVATIRSPKAEALTGGSTASTSGESLRNEVLPIPIYAPFDGIVSRKFGYTGDVVSAGEPILEIQDDSAFFLWGDLPAAYLPLARIGQEVTITFPDLPGKSFTSKIEAINSTVDRQTQTAQIRASLPSPRHLLKSDLFARIEIRLKSLSDVLLVPRNALLSRPTGSFVFIVKKGKAHLREVQPGMGDSDSFVIRSGLAAGDSVVVLGNFELKDDMAVEVMR